MRGMSDNNDLVSQPTPHAQPIQVSAIYTTDNDNNVAMSKPPVPKCTVGFLYCEYLNFPVFLPLLTSLPHIPCSDTSLSVNRVCQGYTAGMNFLNCTLTPEHRTCGGYRYILTCKIGSVQQNPWYNLYLWLF